MKHNRCILCTLGLMVKWDKTASPFLVDSSLFEINGS